MKGLKEETPRGSAGFHTERAAARDNMGTQHPLPKEKSAEKSRRLQKQRLQLSRIAGTGNPWLHAAGTRHCGPGRPWGSPCRSSRRRYSRFRCHCSLPYWPHKRPAARRLLPGSSGRRRRGRLSRRGRLPCWRYANRRGRRFRPGQSCQAPSAVRAGRAANGFYHHYLFIRLSRLPPSSSPLHPHNELPDRSPAPLGRAD